MAEERLPSTAHHEAGHALVAHVLGRRVKGLRSCPEKPERGRALVDKEGITLNDCVRICCAGPLSEIRYEAEQKWRCRLALNACDMEGLVNLVYDERNRHSFIIVVHKFLAADGTPRDFEPPDPNAFSDLNELNKSGIPSKVDKEEFRTLLRETIDLLNDADIWEKVKAVAAEFKQKDIAADRFLEIVAGVVG
jgi:hypothetical protein